MSSFIHSLYLSRKTILELLKEREYDTTKINNFNEKDISNIYNTYERGLDFVLESSKNNKKVFVKYNLKPKLRNTGLKSFVDEFIKDEIEDNDELEYKNIDLIIILRDKPNETLNKITEDFYNEFNLYINLFWVKQLEVNILNHDFVPKHVKISNEKFNELKEIFNLNSRYQFPIISRHDPVANCLGIRPGEIIEIKRASKTAGEYKYYRCCK